MARCGTLECPRVEHIWLPGVYPRPGQLSPGCPLGGHISKAPRMQGGLGFILGQAVPAFRIPLVLLRATPTHLSSQPEPGCSAYHDRLGSCLGQVPGRGWWTGVSAVPPPPARKHWAQAAPAKTPSCPQSPCPWWPHHHPPVGGRVLRGEPGEGPLVRGPHVVSRCSESMGA